MLQRIREGLTIALLALLPLHAFLVTVGTRVLMGPGHAPLAALAIWKEVLLGVILVFAFVEWMKDLRKNNKWQITNGKVDAIDMLIGGLFVLSLIVTAMTHANWGLYALGFKYDLLPLLAFVALRRVSWSDVFFARVFQSIFFVFLMIAVWGIASAFLPMSVFTFLGYSDLHSLYQPGAPLPPFHQIEAIGIRRIQSTFAGPNQLGMWLLLPLGIAAVQLCRERTFARLPALSWVEGLVCSLMSIVLLLTFSRAAWIAAFVIVAIAAYRLLPRRRFSRLAASTITIGIIAGAVALTVLPDVFLRATSTRAHIERPLQALSMMIDHPLGQGLGSAGPASNRVSDACIYLEEGADAAWAVGRDDLCVFVGATQAQPLGRECRCAFLPENWYLQIGVELGWLGMILYVSLIGCVLISLWRKWQITSAFAKASADKNGKWQSGALFLVVLGVSIAALVLHAWEDSAVAYSLWVLGAAALSPTTYKRI